MMSNEEMAVLIQEGHKEYYKILWGNVEKLMLFILNKKIKGVTLPAYVDKMDLQQNLYFAFCKAVENFNKDKPYKFTSYLEFHIRNVTNRYIGRIKKNTECSYNVTIDEEESTEMVETIPLEGADDYVNELDLSDDQRTVRECVAKLPHRESELINLYYLCGNTLQQLAELQGCSSENIRRLIRRGLKYLRSDPVLQELRDDYKAHNSRCEHLEEIYKMEWLNSEEYKITIDFINKRRSMDIKQLSPQYEKTLIDIARREYIRRNVIEQLEITSAIYNRL